MALPIRVACSRRHLSQSKEFWQSTYSQTQKMQKSEIKEEFDVKYQKGFELKFTPMVINVTR